MIIKLEKLFGKGNLKLDCNEWGVTNECLKKFAFSLASQLWGSPLYDKRVVYNDGDTIIISCSTP